MHKSIMTVDNNTFISMIKDLVALLEDTKELAGRPESQQAVEYINEVGLMSQRDFSVPIFSCHPQCLYSN